MAKKLPSLELPPVAPLSLKKDLTYAKSISEELSGYMVEIYLGENYEQIKMDQYEKNIPGVICGKVVGARGNVLIVEANIFNGKPHDDYKKVYINDFAIKFICELDGTDIGVLNIFLDSRKSARTLK